MLHATDVADMLDAVFPDSLVIAAIQRLLSEAKNDDSESVRIQLDGEWVPVTIDASIEIVSKGFVKYYQGVEGLGTFKSVVAIGGFQYHETGIHAAGCCFATLYFDAEGRVVTENFYRRYIDK